MNDTTYACGLGLGALLLLGLALVQGGQFTLEAMGLFEVVWFRDMKTSGKIHFVSRLR